MKSLVAIILLAVAALNAPWLIESTNNNCAALEQWGMRMVAKKNGEPIPPLAAGLMALSDGRIVANAAREKYPNVPPPLFCAATYFFPPQPEPDNRAVLKPLPFMPQMLIEPRKQGG